MKGEIKLWVCSLFCLVSFASIGGTLRVPQDYPTIQAAINAAQDGDEILVAAGTYQENLNITKSVRISGAGTDLVIIQPTGTGYGIGISGSGKQVTLENITVYAGNARNFIIHVYGVAQFTLQNAKILGAGRMVTSSGLPLGGVDVNTVTEVVIRNVEIKDVSRNGVALTNTTIATLENLYVHDTGVSQGWAGIAIYTSAAGTYSVAFVGVNRLENTPMGLYIELLPGSTVGLTVPEGTLIFSGQNVAPLLKSGAGNVPNLDAIAYGLGLPVKVYAPEAPAPYNIGIAFYASLNDALAAAVIDPVLAGYSVVFDLTENQFVVGPGMQIQRAINAAQNSDTVLVKAGEYVTQGIIEKSLTILGEPGVLIKAPAASLRQPFTIDESSRTFDPIIFAYGGTRVGSRVTGPGVIYTDVKGLTIDGQNSARGYPVRFVGILYRNVHGEISGNVVQNMMHPGNPGGGAETFGILVYGDSVVEVLNNVVSGFSRGGIGIIGDMGPLPDPIATVSGNTVIGNGLETATGWWAENGIQIGYGATGVISGNYVTQCWVNSEDWTATGILVASTDNVIVEDNTVVSNQSGIGVAGFGAWGWPSSNGNVIRGNDVIGNMWGIDIQMDANDTLVIYNNIAGNTGAGVSVAQFYGYEPVGTVIRFNKIVGNAIGVENYEVSTAIDAALNWWGDPEGPTHPTNTGGAGDRVTDGVIYSPWLATDPDGDPSTPGVQITGPVRIVVDDIGPEPAGGYLNTAIVGANELPFTDTIEVRHGTYDASAPITAPVTIISQPGSASNTFLTGNLTLRAPGILIGRMGQGFTIDGNITVGPGIDASTIHINWNNILGTVTNQGNGILDARYNWWGGAHPSTRTFGNVAYYPYLPAEVDEVLEFMARHHVDADTAIFLMERGGLVSYGLLVLDLMHRFGFSQEEAESLLEEYGFFALSRTLDFATDYDDFVRLLLGYRSTPAGGAGTFVDRGVAGGAGSFQGQTVDAIYELGEPIFISFELNDFQGNPVTGIGAWVTLIKVDEDGHETIWYWNATRYNPETGRQELSIPTAGLPAGYYRLIINFRDGTSDTVLIQIVANE